MELINKLEEFGLSRREAEVYIALLQKKEFTAPELTKITTITRTKIYEHLQNLVHKGLCNESNKNGQKIYKAVSPKIVLNLIIRKYQQDLEKKRKSSEQLGKELSSLHQIGVNKIEPLDYIEVLNDPRQIRERWFNIEKNLKEELLVFTKPPYSVSLEDNVEEGSKVLKKKKINTRSIYEYNDLTPVEINNLIYMIETYQKLGEQSRIIEKLPMKLAVCDETITMLSLVDKVSLQPGITTIIIDHPGFAVALKNTFESYWIKAMTIEDFKSKIKECSND
jgi:sugar-specific transcriptional regulator TrmB